MVPSVLATAYVSNNTAVQGCLPGQNHLLCCCTTNPVDYGRDTRMGYHHCVTSLYGYRLGVACSPAAGRWQLWDTPTILGDTAFAFPSASADGNEHSKSRVSVDSMSQRPISHNSPSSHGLPILDGRRKIPRGLILEGSAMAIDQSRTP